MGKRGPKPTGQAMTNAERQRLYRERQKERLQAVKPITGDAVSASAVLKEALCKDWVAVIRVMIRDLGHQPTEIDPANYYLTYSFGGKPMGSMYTARNSITPPKRSVPTFCIGARSIDAGIALVKWADDHDAEIEFNGRHGNWEVKAQDPLSIINTFFADDITFKGNEIVCSEKLGNLKYSIIQAMCPHGIKVSANRAIKMHKKWVRDSAKQRWGVLTTYGEVSYYFEREEDAVLARLFIGS